jgi:hypothetical protein
MWLTFQILFTLLAYDSWSLVMNPLKFWSVMLLLVGTSAVLASDEWTRIGTAENGYSVFVTNADGMPDGSWRLFVKAEKELERKPEGTFAMFKKPEKYLDKVAPFAVLVNCKKKAVRDYVAGPLGSEFHVPWQPAVPGSYGALAFKAFCKK